MRPDGAGAGSVGDAFAEEDSGDEVEGGGFVGNFFYLGADGLGAELEVFECRSDRSHESLRVADF